MEVGASAVVTVVVEVFRVELQPDIGAVRSRATDMLSLSFL